MEPRHPKVWWKYSAGTVIIWKLFWLTNKNPCDSYKYITPFWCVLCKVFMFESRVFEQSFLNSLIRNKVYTKEVGTVTVLGYLSLINTDFFLPFIFLRFMFSFSFDWEDTSDTQGRVWPHFHETSWSSSKILQILHVVLSTRLMFKNAVKHCVWYIT